MTTSISQNSFVGGEWAPSLYGRYDLAKYVTAVRKMLNFFPHPHGGASNRGGTEFVCEVKDSTKSVRLIPFQFSVVQSYVLEFGDQYMRVIKDKGLVVETSGAGTDIRAAAYKWTASGSGTNEFYMELAAGGNPGLAEPLSVFEDVGGADTSLVAGTLGALTAGQYGYGDNDALGFDTIYVRLTDNVDPDTKAVGYLEASYIFEITTPFTEAELSLIKFAQSADVMYLTHPSHPPQKLSRLAHDNWTMAAAVFGANIATPTGLTSDGISPPSKYVVAAVNAEGEESLPTGQVSCGDGNTLSWSAVANAEYYNVYKDGNSSGTFGWVGQANSTSFKTPATPIEPDYSRIPPQVNTPFNSTDNYPGCCAFFEQRLQLARTNNQPQTIWGSVVGSFQNLNRSFPLRDDDSYEFTINSLKVNEIRWIVPLNSALLGTSGGEWKMNAGGASDAITPSSVNVRTQSSWGVSDIPPIVIGSTVLFIDGSQKRVRDLLYSVEQDGFAGNDLSVLANHLFKNYSLIDWAYQQHPDSIVWSVRNDGTLLGLTYYREHEVVGWHQHTTDGAFEAVASIQSSQGVTDVYAVVQREIDGVAKRYIEAFADRLPPNANYEVDVEDAWFVDCGLSYDGRNADAAKLLTLSGGTTWDAGEIITMTATGHTPFSGASVDKYYRLKTADTTVIVKVTAYSSTSVVSCKAINRAVPVEFQSVAFDRWALMVTSISGLDHLEAKALACLADGNVVTGLTVESGAVTLPQPAAKITLGLGYVSDIETLDFETATQNGTLQDKQREVVSVLFRLENTRSLQVGPSEDRLSDMAFRESEYYGEPIQLFTGDKEIFTEAGLERQGRVYIRNTYPVPVTILALVARMNYGEA